MCMCMYMYMHKHAAKVGVTPEFEMSEIKSLFNLSLADVKTLLGRFHQLDKSGS